MNVKKRISGLKRNGGKKKEGKKREERITNVMENDAC